MMTIFLKFMPRSSEVMWRSNIYVGILNDDNFFEVHAKVIRGHVKVKFTWNLVWGRDIKWRLSNITDLLVTNSSQTLIAKVGETRRSRTALCLLVASDQRWPISMLVAWCSRCYMCASDEHLEYVRGFRGPEKKWQNHTYESFPGNLQFQPLQ